jgi:hypothetical protein
VVADSAEKTAAAGSSRIALSLDNKQLGTAAFDYEQRSGVVEVDGNVQMIYTPETIYTSLAAIHPRANDRKRWVEYDLMGEARGPFNPFASNPVELLRFLKGASDVERIDTGNERGAEVTRYRARLEIDRAVNEMPAGERESVRDLVRSYWGVGAKEDIPFELAVDGDGRLRRVSVTIRENKPLDVEFYDYGVEVHAKAPPADEVITWEEFSKLWAPTATPEEPE